MRSHQLLLKVSLSIVFGFYLADLNADNIPLDLPPVTVTAPQLPLEQINSNSQSLEEEDLSIAHEPSITNVLEGFSGISITRSGYGQQSALLMRGAGGQGLITLDGIPLLQQLPGLQNLDGLPVESIQKAEIERGPSSVLNPFQALGGAIRLYSQDREKSGARFTIEGGSFGILREMAQGTLAGKLGRITVTLNRGDAFDGTHLANATKNPERDPFRFMQGIVRFSSDINSHLNWQGTMLYRKSSADSDTLGFDSNFRVGFKDDSLSHGYGDTWLAQSSLNAKITPNWHSQFQLGFTQLSNFVKANPLQNELTSRIYLATLRNKHTLINEEQQKVRWQLNWGGQARHEQGHSIQTRFDVGAYIDPGFGELNWLDRGQFKQGVSEFNSIQPELSSFQAERTMAAGFLETEGQYHNLSGQVGFRVEHFDQFGTHPLFKAAATWRITPDLSLRASGGTGYRIPGYTELLSLFFGNMQLKPERSTSADLGLEWFPLKRMRVAINGYYNRYDNLITQAYHPRRGPTTINVADAEVAGVELDLQYAWTDYLDSGISYNFSNSRNFQADQLLPSRPPHTARVWGQQKFKDVPITLWAEAVIRSSTWNDIANTIPIKQSIQINASIRYAISSQLEVYLRGDNLNNNRTQQFYSIDMPGIAVYGGFKMEF